MPNSTVKWLLTVRTSFLTLVFITELRHLKENEEECLIRPSFLCLASLSVPFNFDVNRETGEGGWEITGRRLRVPPPDVRELNLPGLCSGLLSYIRVKWPSLPGAHQDVAEEEGWEGKWVFDIVTCWLSTYSPLQILMNEPEINSLLEDSSCHWMLCHCLLRKKNPLPARLKSDAPFWHVPTATQSKGKSKCAWMIDEKTALRAKEG